MILKSKYKKKNFIISFDVLPDQYSMLLTSTMFTREGKEGKITACKISTKVIPKRVLSMCL
jgi:hypothetical protein